MASIHPQLSHCGVYARDVAKQVEFYTRVVGLVVADRGYSKEAGAEFAFLTCAPEHHHQLVFISGRAPQGVSTVNQLSFKVPSLAELKAMHARAVAAGITGIRQVSHGNALSFYMTDPEGNGIEIYTDTPWYIPQPHGVPVDLSRPEAEILAETREHCRHTPGFLPLDAWKDEVRQRLEREAAGVPA